MAEQEELTIETGNKKKKMIIFGAIALLLVIAIGTTLYFVFSAEDSEQPTTEQTSSEALADEPSVADESARGTALYVAMPRPFVFNVPGKKRERLVQIKVQLMVRGLSDEEAAKTHIPLIEGTLLTVFSHSNAEDLVTEAGKAALRLQALREVQSAFTTVEGRKVAEQVLFTGFVMQ